MPLRQAQKLCPGAVFLEGRHHVYRCFTARIFEMLGPISPYVDTYLDEAFCDLSEVLDHLETSIFFDVCHVSATANRAISDRVAEVLAQRGCLEAAREGP